MFDPFDFKNSPFASAFNDGVAASYLEDRKGLKKREDALKRTHKYTEVLQKRQSEHEEDMAEKYGAPSQVDKSWAAPIADLAKGLFNTWVSSRGPKPDPVQNSLNEMRKYTPDNNLWRPPS